MEPLKICVQTNTILFFFSTPLLIRDVKHDFQNQFLNSNVDLEYIYNVQRSYFSANNGIYERVKNYIIENRNFMGLKHIFRKNS